MTFFESLIQFYLKIKFPEQYLEVSNIEKHISYYLADIQNTFVASSKDQNNCIVELDIKSAFPTLVSCIFGKDDELTQKVNSTTNKKERNILIATTLKDSGHLKKFNMMCKLIILGVVVEIDPNILLLELKKDGCVFACNPETSENVDHLINAKSDFISYVLENNFKFHKTEYTKYLRCNRTSVMFDESQNLIIKGNYKYFPKQIREDITNIFRNENIDTNRYRKIYTKKYFEILIKNNLSDLLERYYICENDKYLDSDGTYVKYSRTMDIDPSRYLRTFVYPSILSTKM